MIVIFLISIAGALEKGEVLQNNKNASFLYFKNLFEVNLLKE
jgi:hypothetical protein